eukprot:scaffold26783_cov47-Phaeocystis_antarctica.AAC.3
MASSGLVAWEDSKKSLAPGGGLSQKWIKLPATGRTVIQDFEMQTDGVLPPHVGTKMGTAWLQQNRVFNYERYTRHS